MALTVECEDFFTPYNLSVGKVRPPSQVNSAAARRAVELSPTRVCYVWLVYLLWGNGERPLLLPSVQLICIQNYDWILLWCSSFTSLLSKKENSAKKTNILLYSSKANVDQTSTNSKKKKKPNRTRFVCTCRSLSPSPMKNVCPQTVISKSDVPQWLGSKNIGCTCTHRGEVVWPGKLAETFHFARPLSGKWNDALQGKMVKVYGEGASTEACEDKWFFFIYIR